jgi:hypothetical protein
MPLSTVEKPMDHLGFTSNLKHKVLKLVLIKWQDL